jgi:preprotein translocase subunit SecF
MADNGKMLKHFCYCAIVLILLSAMGVNSVRDFSIPILVSVIAGTYSSIFISGNFVVLV